MGASDLLEAVKIFGSILAVWFALVGWKLVPAAQERQPGAAAPPEDPAR